MAEQVTGQAWEDLMQEMLFKPLGMRRSGLVRRAQPALWISLEGIRTPARRWHRVHVHL
jgi:CubicO group peptidase (beta-lactamase class C family)